MRSLLVSTFLFFCMYSEVIAQTSVSNESVAAAEEIKRDLFQAFKAAGKKKSALKKVLQHSLDAHYDSLTSAIYESISIVNVEEEKYDNALESITQAIHYTDHIKHKKRCANLYNQAGHICQFLKQFDKSISYYNQALKFYEDLGDQVEVANSYVNIGNTYYKTGNTEESKQNLIKASKSFDKEPGKKKSAKGLADLGKAYDDLGDFEVALSLLNESLIIFESNEDQEGIASTYASIGGVQFNLKQYKAAEESFKKSLELSKKYTYKLSLMESYKGMSQVLSIKKNYKEALEMYDAYILIKDSIYIEEKKAAISTATSQLSLRIKDQELAMAKTKAELSDFIDKKNNQLLISMFLAYVLISLFIIFIFKKYRKGIRLAKQLQAENTTLSKSNIDLSLNKGVLEKSNAAKDKLFSIVAHDLKSPLASIKGFTELLATSPDSFSMAEISSLGKKMNDSLTNLNQLLDNLLKWAMSQSGLMEFQPQKISCVDFVEANIELYKPLADKKMIALNYNKCDCTFDGDINMLNFVLRNIIHNALKFTETKGVISVNSSIKNDALHIAISDNGVGMNSESIENIFHIDRRKKSLGTDNEKGTGLGLVLSKEFMDKNNGKITVNSDLGIGTMFTLILPLSK